MTVARKSTTHANWRDKARSAVGAGPVAVDLFAGCGGLTLGLKKAGFRVVGAVEIDPLAVATYEANHPGVHIWKDIRKVRPARVLGKLGLAKGQLDLLAGCPPCQGFSSIRRLNSGREARDERNNLIGDFLRLVRGLQPKAVLLENVPGLWGNHRLDKFQSELEKLGYLVKAGIRDAQHFGVPQRRRRVILMAARNGKKIRWAPRSPVIWTVRDAIAGLPAPHSGNDGLHNIGESRTARVRNMIARIPKDGGGRGDLPRRYELQCHKGFSGFKDVYGRMAWDKVAPTITGGCHNPSKGRFLHPEENRTVTMREAAILQGFPRRYKFPDTKNKTAVAEMIGNALPFEFVRRHAAQIRRALEQPVRGKEKS